MVTLHPREQRLALVAPEVFAVLVLARFERPWTERDVQSVQASWNRLQPEEARDVFGFGKMILKMMGLLPEGLKYPDEPLRTLSSEEATAWLRQYKHFKNTRTIWT